MTPALPFNFEDAWLLTALFMQGPEKGEVDLRGILAAGDYLNHAIFSLQELQEGFERLQAGGWIMVAGSQLRLTERAVALKEEVYKAKGGQLTLVERTLKGMHKAPAARQDNPGAKGHSCDFLTAESHAQAYQAYMGDMLPKPWP